MKMNYTLFLALTLLSTFGIKSMEPAEEEEQVQLREQYTNFRIDVLEPWRIQPVPFPIMGMLQIEANVELLLQQTDESDNPIQRELEVLIAQLQHIRSQFKKIIMAPLTDNNVAVRIHNNRYNKD